MYRLVIAFAALLVSFAGICQVPQVDSVRSREFSDRYDMLVSRLGADGVGVETVLNNWTEVDPCNRKLLLAKYSYYITKAGKTSIVGKPVRKYLGNAPLFTLKDSTGADVNYFEETVYDDSLFAVALRNIDKAIEVFPHDLDICFMKAASLVAYEKESPDMALVYLGDLIDRYYADRDAEWKYDGKAVEGSFFEDAIQEYCYVFFNIGSQVSYVAFKMLAEKMLEYLPSSTVFLSDMGSYYFVVEKDTKKAMKYYRKVLKISPDDYTASKNCVLIARKTGDVKSEIRYLSLLISSTPDENEKAAAQVRLDFLRKNR